MQGSGSRVVGTDVPVLYNNPLWCVSHQWSAHYDFASRLSSVAEKFLANVLEAGRDYSYNFPGNMSSAQTVTGPGPPALVNRRWHNAPNQIDSWGGPGIAKGWVKPDGGAPRKFWPF